MKFNLNYIYLFVFLFSCTQDMKIIKKHPKVFNREKFRLNYSETELVENLEKIKNPIIRECIKFLKIDDRLYIGTISDVPASTGLGSSSTFCVGLLNALYAFKKKKVSLEKLSEEAAYIERDILKRTIGKTKLNYSNKDLTPYQKRSIDPHFTLSLHDELLHLSLIHI